MGQCHVLGLISGMSLQQYIEFLKEQGLQSADAVSKADAQFRLFMEERRLQHGAEAEEKREQRILEITKDASLTEEQRTMALRAFINQGGRFAYVCISRMS